MFHNITSFNISIAQLTHFVNEVSLREMKWQPQQVAVAMKRSASGT
jgi:hypothetical protein